MHRFRKKPSPSTSPTNSQPPTPTPPIVDYIKQELATFYPQTKDSRALAAASSAIALSIASPSCDPTGTTPDEPGSSKESGWRTAYGAARMAVEVANASSDMFLPLKAVVGALSVLLKNYDVSAPNWASSYLRDSPSLTLCSKLRPMQIKSERSGTGWSRFVRYWHPPWTMRIARRRRGERPSGGLYRP